MVGNARQGLPLSITYSFRTQTPFFPLCIYYSMRREAFKLAAEYEAGFALVYLLINLPTALQRDKGKASIDNKNKRIVDMISCIVHYYH